MPASPDSRKPRVERHRAEQRHLELVGEPLAAAASRRPRRSCSRPRRAAACSSCCAISAARAATSCASGCGVVTITASARGSSWPSEIETSPVPGGMSTTSVSSSPQCTSVRNCSSARCSIGPRHMTGSLSSRKKPIDISFSSLRDRAGRSCGRRRPASGGSRACAGSSGRRRRRRESRRALAELVERGGEVGRERRLADAALAARDRDHAGRRGRAGCPSCARSPAAQPRRQRAALLGRHHAELERDALDAVDRSHAPARPAPRSSSAAGSRRR